MKINWSKIFDWSVVGVQVPYPLRSANGVVSYAVNVMYRHHGMRRVVFHGKKSALSKAKCFSDRMFAKMKRSSKHYQVQCVFLIECNNNKTK